VLKSKLATSGTNSALQKTVTVVEANDSKGRATNEYTISAWIYISQYNSSNIVQGILAFFDSPATASNLSANLYMGLHPTKPMMIVRAGNMKDVAVANNDSFTTFTYSAASTTAASGASPSGSCPTLAQLTGPSAASGTYSYGGTGTIGDNAPCDVMDIDIQRWINVAVSVNGRIMDVYLDGKLARSCIMNNVQNLSAKGQQVIMLCPSSNTFSGYISGVMFSNYAVTPDVIYARYQSGPYFSSSFLDYMVDKLGVRISYTGSDGTTESWNFLESVGLQ